MKKPIEIQTGDYTTYQATYDLKERKAQQSIMRQRTPKDAVVLILGQPITAGGTGTTLRELFVSPVRFPYRKRMFHFKCLSTEVASWLGIGAYVYVSFQF